MYKQSKKVLLVLVEGKTDEEALGLIITKLIINNKVEVKILNCDITSDKSTETYNILEILGNYIREFLAREKYEIEDLYKVVQIVDTDGAYVSNEYIKEDANYDKFYYTREYIAYKDMEAVIERNKKKAGILSKLSKNTTVLKSVPYEIYYFSTNLEHVFHNIQNMPNIEKRKYAELVSDKYYNSEFKFIEDMKRFSVCTGNTYEDSWEYIKKGNNSLKRCSNIYFLFKKERIATVIGKIIKI